MLQRKFEPAGGDQYISVVAEPIAPVLPADAPPADEHALGLDQVTADALEQLRQLAQEHAALSGQVLTLERQVRTLLIERLELSAQVALLQREIAQLRGSGPVDEQPSARAAFPRQDSVVPRRGGLGQIARPSAPVPDDELLLNEIALESGTAPIGEGAAGQPQSSYVLIAQPFGRFSDLGRFQTAVQALRGVQNARVRRFVQGTLEMRLEYDGAVPLATALSNLSLAVERIEQLDPQRLVIRLSPDSLA